MRIRLTYCSILILLSFIIFCSSTDNSSVEDSKVNSSAFSFKLDDLQGSPRTLGDYKSKLILIDFWATWCGPCRESIPHLVKLHKKYSGDLSIVGISLDEAGNLAGVEKFVKNYNISYPILKGNYDIAKKYSISAVPTFLFLDTDGNILKTMPGYRGEQEMENIIIELLGNLKV